MRPTVVDLFAGAGGLTEGLGTTRFDVRLAVDVDATSAASYRYNHPEVTVYVGDVSELTGPRLLELAGLERRELDLLTGCPPCQGFSTLRTRRKGGGQAADDPRNGLIGHFLRLVRSTNPRAVLLENVPNLITDNHFRELEEGLEKWGYLTDCRVLDAQDYGVPQRRKRLILLAAKREHFDPRECWPHAKAERVTVRGALQDLGEAGRSGDVLHDLPERRTTAMMERIWATPVDGGSRRDAKGVPVLPCHKRRDGFSDVYGRMWWDRVAPTITSGCHNPSRGRFLHPERHRAITLREAALLQGFPPDYWFDLSRGKEHAAAQIGNAFPPPLIRGVAKRLRAKLGTA